MDKYDTAPVEPQDLVKTRKDNYERLGVPVDTYPWKKPAKNFST